METPAPARPAASPPGPGDDAMDDLLEALAGGDLDAAERVFLAFEPHLRLVVRRLLSPRLRSKFDSCDIVQSVWADVLKGLQGGAGWRFRDVDQLRAFLVTATRHRFVDRARRLRRALERGSPLGLPEERELPPAHGPRPSEEAQADELWERLLALCPPAHRGLLDQRRRGVPLAEIAAASGLHPSSVRRVFYDLARRVADRGAPDDPP